MALIALFKKFFENFLTLRNFTGLAELIKTYHRKFHTISFIFRYLFLNFDSIVDSFQFYHNYSDCFFLIL